MTIVATQWTSQSWPHDDTADLVTFYGKPWIDSKLLAHCTPPFRVRYEGAPVHGLLVHVKVVPALAKALQLIWQAFACDQAALDATGFTNYSGAFNYRSVRGVARLSCHAFGAALDFDAEHNAMGTAGSMDPRIIDCFKSVGAFWGGDFRSRKDPMHFQFTHE